MLRQPIVTVVGHVDHGKTTLLDRIRQTSVAEKEPGQITQAIGASCVPRNVIEKICSRFLQKFKFEVIVPGLLFIDTPGHEAFTSLRRRGGALADLAVLVIDIAEGIMPQTEESLQILRKENTPFVVALNKIDRIKGWSGDGSFLENYGRQQEHVREEFDKRFYAVLEQLSRHGFSCERFDRISDFGKTVAAVPLSAKTGEGIAELLAVLIGLSQVYLRDRLQLSGEAKGFVLEVKETTGLGKTIDVILYDGELQKGDWLAVGGQNPFVTRIKALLLPAAMREMREERNFTAVETCGAACGVKIAGPDMGQASAGAEVRGAREKEEVENLLEDLEREKGEVEIRTEREGIIIKAESVGSLEALVRIFEGCPIKEATLGSPNREDILKVEANSEMQNRAIIAFNVPLSDEIAQAAKDRGIAILESRIVYNLKDEYTKWVQNLEEETRQKELAALTRPAKLHVLRGFVFRQSNPAIVGCEIAGLARPGCRLFKEGGGTAGELRQIQKEGKNIEEARNGEKVAVSIEGAAVGRQFEEGDFLYSDVGSEEYKKLLQFRDLLGEGELTVLEEIMQLKRKEDRRYGM